MTEIPASSPALLAVCHPRWQGWTPRKPDPCDGCPLKRQCVDDGYFPTALSLPKMIKWKTALNAAAEKLFRA